MLRLTQSRVFKSAGVAAALTSIGCYPRFAFWKAHFPIWYLEGMLFLGSFLLWAFVFAWHTPFTHRPVLFNRVDPRFWALVTGAGIVVAIGLHWFLDPAFRGRNPADYPTSISQWFGMTAFALAFTPLLLTYAPLAWAVRLVRRVWVAGAFTILFGVFVMWLKIQADPKPLAPALFMGLLALRLVLGACSVSLYLRGGACLVWWWTLLLESRHLLDF